MMKPKKTKVLMIGGTGIISTDCTLRALRDPQFEVTLINRGITPSPISGDFRTIHADINDVDAAREKLKGETFDIVCDFISYDTTALEKRLELFTPLCGHYIFISSVMAYRPNDNLLKTEANSRPGNTDWTYGWEKSRCEHLLRQKCAETGMTYTIVRPGYTYNSIRFFNPWAIMHDRSWTIADRLLRGVPILLQDDGMQLCTITHTRDFAKAFVGLFNNPTAANNDFHITSGEYLTWKRVAEIQAELLGVKPVFQFLPAEEICYEVGHDPGQKVIHCTRHDCYDSSKVRAAVPEFKCTTSFEQGMEESIRYYRENPERQLLDPWWMERFDHLCLPHS